MVFNEKTARSVAQEGDRDKARFFKGRVFEIARFHQAIERASERENDDSAIFLVYQGAPGVGKTSLYNHLKSTTKSNHVFVNLGHEALASENALGAALKANLKSLRGHGVIRTLLSVSRRAADKFLGMGDAIDVAGISQATHNSVLVLHIEEAQVFDDRHADGILRLHAEGIGVPCVCLFTGLSNTADRLREMPGMTRIEDTAVVNMGRLSESDCVASTLDLLEACGINSDSNESRALAKHTSQEALEWPQQLAIAQSALASELVRANGDIAAVDRENISLVTRQGRDHYYLHRLNTSSLWTTQTIGTLRELLHSIKNDPPSMSRSELAARCQSVLTSFNEDTTKHDPASLASNLIEKGVVSLLPLSDDRPTELAYQLAVPSIVNYVDRMSNPR